MRQIMLGFDLSVFHAIFTYNYIHITSIFMNWYTIR